MDDDDEDDMEDDGDIGMIDFQDASHSLFLDTYTNCTLSRVCRLGLGFTEQAKRIALVEQQHKNEALSISQTHFSLFCETLPSQISRCVPQTCIAAPLSDSL